MNARERWGLFLIDEPADRILAYPLLTCRAASCAGASIREYCTDGETMARAQLSAFERFGMDGFSLFSDVGILAEAMGSAFVFPEHDVPSLDRPALPALEDPSRLPIPGAGSGRLPVLVEAARICFEEAGNVAPVFAFVPGPFTTAALLCGTETFLTGLVLEPERAGAVLDRACDAAIPFFDALMIAGALPVLVEPLASGSVVSPEMFERFAAPRIRRQTDYLHRFDLDVMLHVCGETGPILPAMAGTGADLLSLDRVDLKRAVSSVGSRVRLVGNVDPAVLLQGSKEDVARAVERAAAAGGANPRGFAASTGCEVPPAAPDENVRAFVDTVREIDLDGR
jgi:uroporphyrinogen decarboxylase